MLSQGHEVPDTPQQLSDSPADLWQGFGIPQLLCQGTAKLLTWQHCKHLWISERSRCLSELSMFERLNKIDSTEEHS